MDHLEGDLAQVSEGEDLGALASIEGIEVALGCASAARTEKGVAVGAAEARSGLVTGSI